jgi:CBS-domain-containing membrane protein
MLNDYVLRHRFSSFPVVDDHDRLVGLTLNRIRALDPERRAACVATSHATVTRSHRPTPKSRPRPCCIA